MRAWILVWVALAGCDDDEPVVETSSGGVAEQVPEPSSMEMEAPPPNPNEACAEVLVVAWQGAEYAADTITRSKEAARARAGELRQRIADGADFAEVARAESDAASTAPRGGLMGTYTRAEWPGPHVPIRDAVFALHDGELGEVVEAPYGWVIPRRCAIEKAHTRHILIRYRGAENAPSEITRTKEEARALATEIRAEATADGADFEAIAREKSEDSSAERGGDVGTLGRGRLAPAYETAAFALSPGDISEVVETDYGFHIIQRVE